MVDPVLGSWLRRGHHGGAVAEFTVRVQISLTHVGMAGCGGDLLCCLHQLLVVSLFSIQAGLGFLQLLCQKRDSAKQDLPLHLSPCALLLHHPQAVLNGVVLPLFVPDLRPFQFIQARQAFLQHTLNRDNIFHCAPPTDRVSVGKRLNPLSIEPQTVRALILLLYRCKSPCNLRGYGRREGPTLRDGSGASFDRSLARGDRNRAAGPGIILMLCLLPHSVRLLGIRIWLLRVFSAQG
mmetsp:Transcript_10776/g.16930  ORF Transcript_10776/g.16930 Transcript_10776/m.16930 type:complete len:237 (-) Transcript_10776:686-1396(-)